MVFRHFQFNDAQALIVAKWQVGVRNVLVPVGIIPYAVPLTLELLRIGVGLRIPQLNLTTATIAAAVIYAFLLVYIVYRINTVANGLKNRRLTLSFDGDTLVIKEGEDTAYIARFEDILRVDYGGEVIRVATKYGAGCVPLEMAPDTFIGKMQAALGKQCRKHRWM